MNIYLFCEWFEKKKKLAGSGAADNVLDMRKMNYKI